MELLEPTGKVWYRPLLLLLYSMFIPSINVCLSILLFWKRAPSWQTSNKMSEWRVWGIMRTNTSSVFFRLLHIALTLFLRSKIKSQYSFIVSFFISLLDLMCILCVLKERIFLKERTFTFPRKSLWINHSTNQSSVVTVTANSASNQYNSTFYLTPQNIQKSSLLDKYPWFGLSAGLGWPFSYFEIVSSMCFLEFFIRYA